MMRDRFERWLSPALAIGLQGPPMLRALLALIGPRAEVRFADDASSAYLGWEPTTGKFVVAIGPAILRDLMTGPEDLLFVIAHELVHLVRGEHTLPPGPAAVAYNLAADALNDAWLTGPAFDGFFSPTTTLPARRSCASPDTALLVPLEAAAMLLDDASAPTSTHASPETSIRFLERRVAPPMPPGPTPYDPHAWAVVHHALHVGGRADTLTLDVGAQLVLPLLSQLSPPPAAAPPLPAAALQALDVLRRESLAQQRTRAAEPRGAVETTPEIVRAQASRSLARFLRGLVDASPGAAPTWSSRGLEARPAEGASRLGRRALVEYRAGLRATPWSDVVPRGGEGPFGLSIYLDVSASMWDELPAIVATVARECADLVSLPVIAFSVEARPVSLGDLARGRVPTDGGTDFTALARDLLARRVARAVVITDGLAGPIAPELLRSLQARHVRLATVFPGRGGTVPQRCLGLPLPASPLDPCCPRGWKLGLGLQDTRRW